MADPILRVVHLSKRYAASYQNSETVVLSDVCLEAYPGESIAIVGPSGSGKSTLLQIIGTLDRPSGGEVWLGDRNVSSLDDRELATLRNRRVGFVFQAHHLLPQCTVLENVLIPALATSATVPGKTVARAQRLLDRVGLAARANHRASQLSGGERQRTAVVRALINEPDLLLADEPTGSLDHKNSQELAGLLRELNREERLTLIVVTHSLELARTMERVLQLSDGVLKPATL